jgi:hypothetical protein
MMSQPKIFLSVGRASKPEQEDFIRSVEDYLNASGFIPQTVGRTYFSSQQPLKTIAELMHECSGTVILAFERLHIVTAVDKRGSPKETPLADVNLPTVWNQIEATMAYMATHPLLVLVENGLRHEGLLEQGYDWYVKSVSLDRGAFADREFIGIYTDWKKRVEQRAATLAQADAAPQLNDIRNLAAVAEGMTKLFAQEELVTLCGSLGVELESIAGNHAKPVQALEVVQHFERVGRSTHLIDRLYQLRPEGSWLKLYSGSK